jgi:hypothetical protein
MGADPRLILYGNSVMLAGIGTELQRHGLFDLITLEPGCPGALHRICALEPRAVLFDLAAAQPDFTIALLRDRPELILIGVDPSSDKVLLLSGRQERPASVADLLQVLGVGGTGPDLSPVGLAPTSDRVAPMPGLSPGQIREVAKGR